MHDIIIATILAKNEDDIIAEMIEHHISQGVSKFILTDNASTDRTKEIAQRYPEVAEIIDESGDDHSQAIWVTRMARLACKFKPHWIIHLDADELWSGLHHLRHIKAEAVSCQTMYLHPPVAGTFSLDQMRYYMNFDKIPIPQEAKIAHRPNPNIEITHGNHSIVGSQHVITTSRVYRHHYPIRSLAQWEKKAQGHLALMKRNAVCDRWRRWYELYINGQLPAEFAKVISLWNDFRNRPNHQTLQGLMLYWSKPEVIKSFDNDNLLPQVGEWPKRRFFI